MAVKKNANTTTQTEPATDAAMVEATAGAAEQTVTPPVQAGSQGEGQAPATPATVEVQVIGQTAWLEGQVVYTLEDKKNGENKVFSIPSVVTVEGSATCDADELKQFLAGIDGMFAGLLAEAGVLVRKDGEGVPPTGEDILAISMKDEGTVVVTKDGRKFWLTNNGAINEAQ